MLLHLDMTIGNTRFEENDLLTLFANPETVMRAPDTLEAFHQAPYPLLVRLSVGLKAVCLLLDLFRYSLHLHIPRHGKLNYNSDETTLKALAEVTVFLR